jgi:ABC-type nitrate/sulfonate/bicarbonate transport system substrate-binding protein
LVEAGYSCFRVELVDEAPEVVQELLEGYRAALEGSRKPREVWELLKGVTAGQGGVGPGSLEVKAERAASSLRPTARR